MRSLKLPKKAFFPTTPDSTTRSLGFSAALRYNYVQIKPSESPSSSLTMRWVSPILPPSQYLRKRHAFWCQSSHSHRSRYAFGCPSPVSCEWGRWDSWSLLVPGWKWEYLHLRGGFNHDFVVEDLLPDHAFTGVEEGWLFEDDFEENAPKCPDIRLLPADVVRE